MKNMEKELKIEASLEEKLREGVFHIERTQLSEQCDKCMNEDNDFQFHQEGWLIEGEFYCPKHKEGAIKALEEIDRDAKRRKLKQECIIEERQRINEQTKKEWAAKGENLELRERLEQKRKELEERRKGKKV